ncbi:MAG: TolC family protein [Verrucomicrobia bacterium]|nr:TolC family protein [Verrucomicrobiota bacterium]
MFVVSSKLTMSPFAHFFRPYPSLGLALLISAVGVPAQETKAPTLSLNAALQRAVEQNPNLVAQGYSERAAAALIEQAGVRTNPTLDVSLENFIGTGALRGVNGLEATVGVSQVIERGDKRSKRVALAGRDREIAAAAYAVHRAEVLAATAADYVATHAAQARLRLAAATLDLARETLAASESRFKAGAASPAEPARARAALASAQAEFARAQASLANARAALAANWGGDAGEVGDLAGVLRLPETLPSEESLLTKLSRHPRIEYQQAIIASRRAALDLERAQAAQDVTASGGVRFLREGSDAAFVAGVSIPLPVRNQNQGNIRAARATLAGAEQSVRAVELELRVALGAAWRDLQVAHTAAKNLRGDALPATEEAHASVRLAYEAGQLPLIDVLDAQRELAALRREILDADTDFFNALIRAQALTDPAFTSTPQLFSSP